MPLRRGSTVCQNRVGEATIVWIGANASERVRKMRTSTSQEVTELRKWAREYGKATRQLSVRAKSTKDNPGTLPISAYGRCVLTANLFSCLVEITNSRASQGSSSSESDSEATAGDCGPIFLVLLCKGSTLLVSHDQRTSGMFLLEVLETKTIQCP